MTQLTALDLVREDLNQVDEKMRARLVDAFPPVARALGGLLGRGGKRLRPAISLLAARFHPCDISGVLSIAAAAETLHTATLVHDDVIDGAILRRGAETLNAAWSHGATVLAGDYLFAISADFAAECANPRVIRIFSHTLMTICDGELRQLFSALNWQQPKDDYYYRIFAKTASLFQSAAETGAILSGVSEEVVQALRTYGNSFGMAFQIVDDVLDFIGDESTMGKAAGSDLRQGTLTLPTFYFLQNDPRAADLVAIVQRARANGGGGIEQAIALIRDSDAIEAAKAEAHQFVAQAHASLSILPATPARDALASLADFVVDRRW